eukprot:jgi/Mesvir1/11869/Mv00215-RA.3
MGKRWRRRSIFWGSSPKSEVWKTSSLPADFGSLDDASSAFPDASAGARGRYEAGHGAHASGSGDGVATLAHVPSLTAQLIAKIGVHHPSLSFPVGNELTALRCGSVKNTFAARATIPLDQAITAVRKGAHLLKYGRRGKPHVCYFKLEEGDVTSLIWQSPNSKRLRRLPLNIVEAIYHGQKTRVFKRFKGGTKDHLSFSLIYKNGQRSLDLVAKDEQELEVWVMVLRALTMDAMCARDQASGDAHRPATSYGDHGGPSNNGGYHGKASGNGAYDGRAANGGGYDGRKGAVNEGGWTRGHSRGAGASRSDRRHGHKTPAEDDSGRPETPRGARGGSSPLGRPARDTSDGSGRGTAVLSKCASSDSFTPHYRGSELVGVAIVNNPTFAMDGLPPPLEGGVTPKEAYLSTVATADDRGWVAPSGDVGSVHLSSPVRASQSRAIFQQSHLNGGAHNAAHRSAYNGAYNGVHNGAYNGDLDGAAMSISASDSRTIEGSRSYWTGTYSTGTLRSTTNIDTNMYTTMNTNTTTNTDTMVSRSTDASSSSLSSSLAAGFLHATGARTPNGSAALPPPCTNVRGPPHPALRADPPDGRGAGHSHAHAHAHYISPSRESDVTNARDSHSTFLCDALSRSQGDGINLTSTSTATTNPATTETTRGTTAFAGNTATITTTKSPIRASQSVSMIMATETSGVFIPGPSPTKSQPDHCEAVTLPGGSPTHYHATTRSPRHPQYQAQHHPQYARRLDGSPVKLGSPQGSQSLLGASQGWFSRPSSAAGEHCAELDDSFTTIDASRASSIAHGQGHGGSGAYLGAGGSSRACLNAGGSSGAYFSAGGSGANGLWVAPGASRLASLITSLDSGSIGDVFMCGRMGAGGFGRDEGGAAVPVTPLRARVGARDTLFSSAVLKQVPNSHSMDVQVAACGDRHGAFVNRSGELYTWGVGDKGLLGHGVTMDMAVPRVVEALTAASPGDPRVEQVACGSHHTAALLDNGDVYTWGDGVGGVLGHGDEEGQCLPRLVAWATPGVCVRSLACGTWHTACTTEAGELYTWGEGYFGMLGHGDRRSYSSPRLVASLCAASVASVACGSYHTAALVEERGPVQPAALLYTWGDGDKGRLGHGKQDAHLLPHRVEELAGIPLRMVACGEDHTCALSMAGRVYCWGGNTYGQLGLGNRSHCLLPALVEGCIMGVEVEAVACGRQHTVAVGRHEGALFSWGCGEGGRLGHGDGADRLVPERVSGAESLVVVKVSCGAASTIAVCQHTQSASQRTRCAACKAAFKLQRKPRTCYQCGRAFCRSCLENKAVNTSLAPTRGRPFRVCEACYASIAAAANVLSQRKGARGPRDSTSSGHMNVRRSSSSFSGSPVETSAENSISNSGPVPVPAAAAATAGGATAAPVGVAVTVAAAAKGQKPGAGPKEWGRAGSFKDLMRLSSRSSDNGQSALVKRPSLPGSSRGTSGAGSQSSTGNQIHNSHHSINTDSHSNNNNSNSNSNSSNNNNNNSSSQVNNTDTINNSGIVEVYPGAALASGMPLASSPIKPEGGPQWPSRALPWACRFGMEAWRAVNSPLPLLSKRNRVLAEVGTRELPSLFRCRHCST